MKGGRNTIRTRYRTFQSYGITRDEAETLKEYVRGQDFCEEVLLLRCCEQAHAGISDFLFKSLRYGSSYDKMSRVEYIPIGRDDFYGWQRKALALFKGEMDTMKNSTLNGQTCPELPREEAEHGKHTKPVSTSTF